MPRKKRVRSTPISDSEILAMYEVILPLIYDNPERLDVAYQINRRILALIPFNFLHYVMQDKPLPKRFDTLIETWSGFGHGKQVPDISMVPATETEPDEAFEESVRRNYSKVIEQHILTYPESKDFHYHKIESRMYPRIVVGFFRDKNAHSNNRFTKVEIERFDQLTPHVLRLFRVALTQVQQSEAFKYFDSFAKIGSQLATEYELSDAEVRLIPDILFGYSIEEIAERQFVSLATVKTHVNHILKKTGTKSRLDFIGKFFTSPDHVQL